MKTTATATAPPASATPPSSIGSMPSMGAGEPPAVVVDSVDVEAIDDVVLVAPVWLEVDVRAGLDDVLVVVVVVVELLVVVEAILLVVEEVEVLLAVVVEMVLLVVVL